tara:strand:+ start:12006 stop:12281 length:276 start_codon:yes stop_codon:yes gene_type:complete
MYKDSQPNDIENWVCVLERNTNLEIELAKDYLSNLEIPSNILSKQDSAFSLIVGDMARVYLYVPLEFEKQARKALLDLENGEDFDENGEDD